MKNIFGKYSLIGKVAIVVFVVNLLFYPIRSHIGQHIYRFPSSFNKGERLFHFDRAQYLAYSSHIINRSDNVSIVMIGDSKIEDYYVAYEDSIVSLVNMAIYGDEKRTFNFGYSGTKAVYVSERIEKALSYSPELIVWQMGGGSFVDIDWVFPWAIKRDSSLNSPYNISFKLNPFVAYKDIFKLNNENAPFISRNLRNSLIPLAEIDVFLMELIRGVYSRLRNAPIVYPNDYHRNIQLGDIDFVYDGDKVSFDPLKMELMAIDYVLKLCAEKDVKLLIYLDPVRPDVRDAKYGDDFYESLKAEILERSKGYKVHLLDLSELVPSELFIDGGHIKEEGNMLVAQAIVPIIKQILNIKP